MYKSFREIAERKYARMLSKNTVSKVCGQFIHDIVGEDAHVEKYFGDTLLIKCKNASVAAFLRIRERGILDAARKFGIKTIRYKT